jgi:uncharacterized protein (TIGR01777 family)
MDVVISGSSGLIGSALVEALPPAGHRPIRLVRRAPRPGHDEVTWDPVEGTLDAGALEGVDAVVNLAGAGIGERRWSERYKREVLDSRVRSTGLLAATLAGLARPPKVLLSASGAHYYGDRGSEVLTEDSAPGTGFLAGVVRQWEAAAQPAIDAGVTTTFLRSAVVLARRGGALGKQLPLFRLGLGGRIGSGTQYLSWITLADQVAAMIHLLERPLAGPVNLSSPNPVTNLTFTKALGRVLRRPTLLPVPTFALKALLGAEMAQELLLSSLRVLPSRLELAGFGFQHREIEPALQAVLDR